MRSSALAVVLLGVLLSASALAGCLDDIAPQREDADGADGEEQDGEQGAQESVEEPDPGDEITVIDGSDGATINGTEGPVNRPPLAVLTSDFTTGQVPFNVTFQMDGDDPDGDDLLWMLDVGDDNDPVMGSDLPATYTHAYEEAEEFTVMFGVFDGELDDFVFRQIDVLEGPNEAETGTGAQCLFRAGTGAGYEVPDLQKTLAQNDDQGNIKVEAGTLYRAWHEPPEDPEPYDTLGLEPLLILDFFDEGHEWVGAGSGSAEAAGRVPEEASYAIACVAHFNDTGTSAHVYIPLLEWTWGYQDGFIEPS